MVLEPLKRKKGEKKPQHHDSPDMVHTYIHTYVHREVYKYGNFRENLLIIFILCYSEKRFGHLNKFKKILIRSFSYTHMAACVSNRVIVLLK